jgi:cytoskeletal protein RodZ
MSAQPIEKDLTHGEGEDHGRGPDDESTAAPAPIEVRRNAAVSGVLGAASSAIAIAYLWRAVASGAPLDWLLCLALGAMAATFLRGLLDSRTPLLVADEMGVRIRLGSQWRGLPWEAIDRVVVTPRRGVLHDGRMVVSLRNLQRAIEGLEGRAARHARLNQKMYGAALAVPLGLTTRVTGDEDGDLGDRVASLSQGRAEVVTLLDTPGTPKPADSVTLPETDERPVITDDTLPASDRRPRWLRRSQEAAPGATDSDEESAVPVVETAEETDAPSRRRAFRVVDALSDGRAGRVQAIAKLGDPVQPLVIGDFEPEPAYDPVIGPELSAARNRVGLSVDELADRTRIRPHVIESIEVDDFTPCGGDFYARGHIRTLARVLGKDPAPMLAQFEERYATAPVNARRVFEAELATGLTGSMRSTVGGPNWMLLVGAVLTLILVWSGVRLFAGDSQEVFETPPPVLNGSAGLSSSYGEPRTPAAKPPVATTLTAVSAGTHVEVRDGEGNLIFEGDLVIGEVKRVEVDPPVTVSSDNGGALSVTLNGRDMGFIGEPDQPATEVYQRPGE